MKLAKTIHDRRSPASAALTALLACLAALVACANAGDNNEADQTPVARVDSDSIELAEVDQRIKDLLFAEKFPTGRGDSALYNARRDAIDQIVDERLLARHSEADNLGQEEWLAARIADLPEITDGDVERAVRLLRGPARSSARFSCEVRCRSESNCLFLQFLIQRASAFALLSRPRPPFPPPPLTSRS